MILVFIIADLLGKERTLSVGCGPSTTAAGAIQLLRMRICIPNDVKVELYLENDIPIKHLTTPLTSLRKQRHCSQHVLRIRLVAKYTGPQQSMDMITFSTLAEMESTEEDEEEEEDQQQQRGLLPAPQGHSSHSDPNADGHVSRTPLRQASPHCQDEGGGSRNTPGKRIIIERTSPQTARGVPTHSSPQRLSLSSVMISRPVPMTARGVVKSDDGIVNCKKKSNSSHSSERVTKRNPLLAANNGMGVIQSNNNNNSSSTAVIIDRECNAQRDCSLGQIIISSFPKLVDADCLEKMVSTVANDAHLRLGTYNPKYSSASAIPEMSDVLYSRYVSTGMIYGIELKEQGTSPNKGKQIGLYGDMMRIRHSCRPNAAIHYDLYTDPFTASCRCAVMEGLRKGDKITCIYRKVDALPFLLLSRERRRQMLRKLYFFDCTCARCEPGPSEAKKGSDSHNVQQKLEDTLTGCFFTDSAADKDPALQSRLSEEMGRDFDALMLVDDDGVEITLCLTGHVSPSARTQQCNKLYAFLQKYGVTSSLRLHEHHWRMNLVRMAYIQEMVRLSALHGATADARRKEPHSLSLFKPPKTVYDVCLTQLAVEALFIPMGHPHLLTTFESFQFLVSILPPVLAESVMSKARRASGIPWRKLEATKEAWSALKRGMLPPNVRKMLAAKLGEKETK